MSDYERIRGLVRREVESIPSPARRSALEAILVHPTPAGRGAKPPWKNERRLFWIVARDRQHGVELIYSDESPNPESRWGFIYEGRPTPIPNTQWTWYLEEAFIRSGAWTAPVTLLDQQRFHVPPRERFEAEDEAAAGAAIPDLDDEEGR